MITQNPCRHVGYFLFLKKYFCKTTTIYHIFSKGIRSVRPQQNRSEDACQSKNRHLIYAKILIFLYIPTLFANYLKDSYCFVT